MKLQTITVLISIVLVRVASSVTPVTAEAIAKAINDAHQPPGTPLVLVTDGKGGISAQPLKSVVSADRKPAKSSSNNQPAGGNAQDKAPPKEVPSEPKDMTLKDMSDAFAAPQTPAAAALGISGDNVQHVKTPKQLIPTVINGLDDQGHFQSGFAVDYALFQHAWGKNTMQSELAAESSDGSVVSAFRRIAVRTQLSFATIKGTSDADKSTKFALGIHSVLFAANDPMLNGEITREQRFEPKKLHLNEWLQGQRERHPDNFLQALGRHSNFSAGAAPSWMSNGEGGSYAYNGTTAWATYVYTPSPLDPGTREGKIPVQLIASAVYHNGQKVAGADAIDKAPATGPISQDSVFLVGGFEFGTYTTRIRATGAFLEMEQAAHGHDQAWRYGFTLEQFLTDNTWLSVSVEKDSGHSNGRNPTLVLTGIKYAFGGNDFYADDKIKKENAKGH